MRKTSGAEALSVIFPFLIGGAMFCLTIGTTIGLVSTMLPADAQGRAWFAVIALEGGLIIWPAMFRYACHGPMAAYQKFLTGLMSLVCFGGVAAAFIIETHTEAARRGVAGGLDKGTSDIAVWIVDGVILLTILAAITHHQLSPKRSDGYVAPIAPPQPVERPVPQPPRPLTVERPAQAYSVRDIEPPTLPAERSTIASRPALPTANFHQGGRYEHQSRPAPKLSRKHRSTNKPAAKD